MNVPKLPEQTHSRTVVVAYGLLFVFSGVGLFALTALVVETTTVSLQGYGYAIAVFLFGLLLTASTPATGAIEWKLRIYRLQLAIVTVVPLAATIPVLTTRYWIGGVTGVLPLGLLYLALQIDWDDARRHLERVRSTDDPDAVQWIPPQSLTLGRHVMGGVGSVVLGFAILALGSMPPLAGALVGLAFLVVGVALPVATPHRGSVERTTFALKTLVFGPGICLLLAGLVLAAGGGSIVAGVVLSGVGVVPLYYGLVRADWELTRPIIREMRTADEVTWALVEEAKETVLSRQSGADVSGPPR